jgi:hypothetical protein
MVSCTGYHEFILFSNFLNCGASEIFWGRNVARIQTQWDKTACTPHAFTWLERKSMGHSIIRADNSLLECYSLLTTQTGSFQFPPICPSFLSGEAKGGTCKERKKYQPLKVHKRSEAKNHQFARETKYQPPSEIKTAILLDTTALGSVSMM